MINKYIHRCIIEDGWMAGNKHEEEVEAYQVEFQNTCEHCGQLLATEAQIIAHIYQELTK